MVVHNKSCSLCKVINAIAYTLATKLGSLELQLKTLITFLICEGVDSLICYTVLARV